MVLKKLIWKHGLRIAFESIALGTLLFVSSGFITEASNFLVITGVIGFLFSFLIFITLTIGNFVAIKKDVESFKDVHDIMGDNAL